MAGLGGLKAVRLTLARGGQVLFRDLSFEIAAGEALSVEGPNGAGKTSLLRLIAGFLEQRAGTVALTLPDGETVVEREERAQFVCWLGHQDGNKTQLTPAENLAFFAQYFAGGDVERALDRSGLSRVRDLPVQYLSAGQKKRLALARLMLGARPLWLLDEPLSALDTAGRALATDLIAQHCRKGGIVAVATHEPLAVPCRHLPLGSP